MFLTETSFQSVNDDLPITVGDPEANTETKKLVSNALRSSSYIKIKRIECESDAV